MKITVDFTKTTGTIKALHGVDNCPVRLRETKIPEFEDAGIPYVRTHDSGGYFGGGLFIDIPNIFRDFDADPEDPDSYDFAFTDIYVRNLVNSGCQVFYRLGVTIENYIEVKSYRIFPPKDNQKWAKICEMIIRHYNEGWANGFHYGIEYWEIWNEPENPPMWKGTKEEFFQLYAAASRHLKKCFPEIKIGGYASCGFYAVTGDNTSDFYKSFITWFDDFLVLVKKENLPFDFFSWHLYTAEPEKIIAHAEYVDQKLQEAGFGHVEQIFNEWNLFLNRGPWQERYDKLKECPTAIYVAKAFILMQHSPIGKAMYYDAEPTRGYCGLFYFPSQKVTPTYYAFKAFNELYKRKNEVRTKGGTKHVTVLAAADGNSGAVLLANTGRTEKELELNFKPAEVILLDKDHNYIPAKKLLKRKVLTLPAESLVVLHVPFTEKKQETEKEAYVSHAGISINGIAE